jgi:hypothetical protein
LGLADEGFQPFPPRHLVSPSGNRAAIRHCVQRDFSLSPIGPDDAYLTVFKDDDTGVGST